MHHEPRMVVQVARRRCMGDAAGLSVSGDAGNLALSFVRGRMHATDRIYSDRWDRLTHGHVSGRWVWMDGA